MVVRARQLKTLNKPVTKGKHTVYVARFNCTLSVFRWLIVVTRIFGCFHFALFMIVVLTSFRQSIARMTLVKIMMMVVLVESTAGCGFADVSSRCRLSRSGTEESDPVVIAFVQIALNALVPPPAAAVPGLPSCRHPGCGRLTTASCIIAALQQHPRWCGDRLPFRQIGAIWGDASPKIYNARRAAAAAPACLPEIRLWPDQL